MSCVRISGFGDGRDDLAQDEDAAEGLVLGHLPDEPGEEGHLSPAIEQRDWSSLCDGWADAT